MDHATARMGSEPEPEFAASVMWNGTYVEEPESVVEVLNHIFPNMIVKVLPEPVSTDPDGVWSIPVPKEVAAEVLGGVDFGWTEPYDDEEGGEQLVSVFIPAP